MSSPLRHRDPRKPPRVPVTSFSRVSSGRPGVAKARRTGTATAPASSRCPLVEVPKRHAHSAPFVRRAARHRTSATSIVRWVVRCPDDPRARRAARRDRKVAVRAWLDARGPVVGTPGESESAQDPVGMHGVTRIDLTIHTKTVRGPAAGGSAAGAGRLGTDCLPLRRERAEARSRIRSSSETSWTSSSFGRELL